MRLRFAYAFILAVMTLAASRAHAGPSANTTAQLTIDGATCSGTIVAPNTILSAAHCFETDDADETDKFFGHVAPPPPPTTMLVDGYKVYIIAIVTDDADHAMVKTDVTFQNHATLGPRPEVGAKVHYWGNPAKVNDAYREGYVTSYHHGEMAMDVNGFFGDSGAGIFDESGKVVGVMSTINIHPRQGLVFRLMGAKPLEFTPLQYSMMGVTAP
jgi:Trypsin-like peptidase domain